MSGSPTVERAFGPYRITGELGRGGMGVVYAAVHDGLNRKVAVKVLAPELARDPTFRRRFEQEAGALASLYSPHIIDIYDHGEQDGSLFIATPLVTGGDLSALLRGTGPLPPEQALDVVAQVCSALADAHGAGVVHRDVKPGNVLLHRLADGGLFAYLGDFGIAQPRDHDRTRTEGVVGTLAYVAPERHRGEDATVATDIYSLGCLLFAALTGRPPYQGSDFEVARQHLQEPVPAYVGGGAAHGLVNEILRRALAKRPEDRYPSAAEMRADLLRAQRLSVGSAGVTEATPTNPVPPPRRRPPRSVLRWAALGVALLLAVTGTVLGVRAAIDDDPGTDGDDRATGTATGTGSGAGPLWTCWNGAQVTRRVDCTQPTGVVGLRWVFPSLDRDFDRCHRRLDVTPDASLRSWMCTPRGAQPGEGVSYTEWTDPAAARRYYGRQHASSPVNFLVEGRPVGHRWVGSEPTLTGFFKVSVAYLNLPFSASLYSRSEAGLEQMCNLLTVRSPRTFLAMPTPCTDRLAR